RQNRTGRVGAHQKVHLVDGDELLVERARELGLRLVVLDDPLDRAPQQAVLLVDLLDVDLADDLMDETRRRQRARERQRAADADRRTGGRGPPTDRGKAQDDAKRGNACRTTYASYHEHLPIGWFEPLQPKYYSNRLAPS